jgi:serine protease
VRMRNRGGGKADATARLFVSPAATLITPDRWQPVGSVDVDHVAQGDALAVSRPLTVDPPTSWPQDPACWEGGIVPPYSFLAIQQPADASHGCYPGCGGTGLPPGPPYFDWTAFRAFLRAPGVAWRNVHSVVIGPQLAGKHVTLAFLIAGAPDQTHTFALEVLQRLPAKVGVRLEVPSGFAAKLRQRQPWVANGSAALALPPRPRTVFPGVSLAAGTCIRAAFKVKVASPAHLVHGHSLAIRQLWRGEEVGRITWWFVEP